MLKYLSLLTASTALLFTGEALAEDFQIGLATAQSGVLAPYDQPALNGFRMGIDEINAKGGLAGKYPVKLIIKDTRSDMSQTAAATQELVDDGVKFVISPCDADASIAAGQVTQPAGIPTMTFCGSAPVLTTAVGDVMFGSYPADNLQATKIADYASRSGLKTAYIMISPDSAYHANLPEFFATVFEKKGGKIIGRGNYSVGQPDFSAEVTKIKNLAEKPDIIFTAAYEPDFPAFIQQLRAAGVTVPVWGADAINTPTVAGLGNLVNGVLFTAPGHAAPGSKLEAFNEEFKKVYGHAPESAYEANGYEIAGIIDAAVTTAGSTDPAAIREAISHLKDFEGVTGRITYEGTTGMPVRSVALYKYQDGKAVFLESGVPTPEDIPAP
ncbi:ABC transporter substrate-binding protein [Brucella oryzae]|uniref:ABC transporter substrate-binding protein n=2 Tax=Brucella oryzae TaxID=335286 RepID=A0A2S7IWR2_9HYPH|nr:ABC transporter substrate-binding protein [Brucella oryzae]